MEKSKNKDISIYVHFPYCVRKCRYCDFVSFPCNIGRDVIPENLCDYYIREIELWCRKMPMIIGRNVGSIYFGGGTPSLMPVEWVERIIETLCRNFSVVDDAEVTLEVNPATVTVGKISDFRLAGVNRISLGVQSLRDDRLQFLGRVHNAAQAQETLGWVKRYFDNISCDFIYATPNQTLSEWQNELEEVISLGVPHLSLYQLIVEAGTPIAKMVDDGEIKPVGECLAERMFMYTNKRMDNVCPQYEISNYAVGYDMQSRHNVNYWVGGDYLGIGVAAAGRIYDVDGVKFWQSENPKSVKKWYQFIDNEKLSVKSISKRARAEELLIMGLRRVDGINFAEFYKNCGKDFFRVIDMERVKNLIHAKMLILDRDSIRVTRRGMNVLDAIIREIVV